MELLSERIARAKKKAYTYLDYRARTRKEMTDYLTKQRFEPEVVSAVVDDLIRLKVIDDLDFSQQWLALQLKNKPLGRRAAAFQLRKRGIDQETVETALEEAFATTDECDLARAVLQKRLLPGKPADEKLKRRLAALLERRGFATHTIYTVLSEI